MGPVWVDLLLRLKLFTSYQAAYRRLSELEKDKAIGFLGYAKIDGKRRSSLYSNRKIPETLFQHEIMVMQFIAAYWPCDALTGFDTDRRWRADIDLMTVNRYRVEIDNGTEPLFQVKGRIDQYGAREFTKNGQKVMQPACPDPVLFVARTEKRINDVRSITQNPMIYFATLEQVRQRPYAPVWINCLGETGVVEETVKQIEEEVGR